MLALTTFTHEGWAVRIRVMTSPASVVRPRSLRSDSECLLSPTSRIWSQPLIGPPSPLGWSCKIFKRRPSLCGATPTRIEFFAAPVSLTRFRSVKCIQTPASVRAAHGLLLILFYSGLRLSDLRRTLCALLYISDAYLFPASLGIWRHQDVRSRTLFSVLVCADMPTMIRLAPRRAC